MSILKRSPIFVGFFCKCDLIFKELTNLLLRIQRISRGAHLAACLNFYCMRAVQKGWVQCRMRMRDTQILCNTYMRVCYGFNEIVELIVVCAAGAAAASNTAGGGGGGGARKRATTSG